MESEIKYGQRPPLEQIVKRINWSNKKVGLIAGCFCPPHRGHYEMVLNSIKTFNLNIVVLRVVGNPNRKYTRHGVTEQESINIWYEWGKTILRKHNVIIIPISITTQLDFIPKNILLLFRIGVAETDEELKEEKEELMKIEQERKDAIRTGNKIRPIIFARNVPAERMTGQILTRNPDSGLSATKFVECLEQLKPTRRGVPNINNCLKYVPYELSENERVKYIYYLLTLPLVSKRPPRRPPRRRPKPQVMNSRSDVFQL